MGIANQRTVTKTRRKTRDIDQIKADIQNPRHLAAFISLHAPEELPDTGKWYCVECAKWLESQSNLEAHGRGKPHKRRVKQLKETPYSQKEAEAAVGIGTLITASKDAASMDDISEVDITMAS